MAVGLEAVAICLVELRLELHPVQPQGVQHALKAIHAQKDTNSDPEPHGKRNPQHNHIAREGHGQPRSKRLLEEYK